MVHKASIDGGLIGMYCKTELFNHILFWTLWCCTGFDVYPQNQLSVYKENTLSPDEEGPINLKPALFIPCRKMPCSGQRQHQSLRHQQSRLAAPLPRLPAAAPLQQAQLWPLLGLLRRLSRRAATPLKRLLLPVETMMVTLHLTQVTNHAPQRPFYQAAIILFYFIFLIKFSNYNRSLKQNSWGFSSDSFNVSISSCLSRFIFIVTPTISIHESKVLFTSGHSHIYETKAHA